MKSTSAERTHDCALAAAWERCAAAVAGESGMATDPFCSAVSGLSGDCEIVYVSNPCVSGVHAAGLPRTRGGAGLPSTSAEAAGGVKRSTSVPSAASCGAVLLTLTDVRSYRRAVPASMTASEITVAVVHIANAVIESSLPASVAPIPSLLAPAREPARFDLRLLGHSVPPEGGAREPTRGVIALACLEYWAGVDQWPSTCFGSVSSRWRALAAARLAARSAARASCARRRLRSFWRSSRSVLRRGTAACLPIDDSTVPLMRWGEHEHATTPALETRRSTATMSGTLPRPVTRRWLTRARRIDHLSWATAEIAWVDSRVHRGVRSSGAS